MLTKVEEELSKDVDGKEAVGADVVVGETHDDEEDGQDGKATKLDRLAAEDVNSGNGNPVSRNGAGEDDDDVSNGGVVQVTVDIVDALGGVANDIENGAVVQGEAVEGDIEAEP